MGRGAEKERTGAIKKTDSLEKKWGPANFPKGEGKTSFRALRENLYRMFDSTLKLWYNKISRFKDLYS